jgi:hypothetical protein
MRRAVLLVRFIVFVSTAFAGMVDLAVAETVREPAPGIVQAEPEIQRHIDEMLERSPTFRQQYQRILDAPHVIVTARLDPTVFGRSFRARSTIRRYTSGLIVVLMEIAPSANQAQWIAHEFEHVVEQLDGVDVRTDAARGTGGSWYSADHAVETLRAVRAGRQVQSEVRRAESRSDKVVESGQ